MIALRATAATPPQAQKVKEYSFAMNVDEEGIVLWPAA